MTAVRIPMNSATDSGSMAPAIPIQTRHRFRSASATHHSCPRPYALGNSCSPSSMHPLSRVVLIESGAINVSNLSGSGLLLGGSLWLDPAAIGPSRRALKSCQGATTSDRFQVTNLKPSLARLGHKQPVAAHSQIWPRRDPERQVSGDESGPLVGSARPGPVVHNGPLKGTLDSHHRVVGSPTARHSSAGLARPCGLWRPELR